MAARLGLEPRQAESESAVLPLHHRALRVLKFEIREMEPATGIEPVTACLQNRCSTIELRRRKLGRLVLAAGYSGFAAIVQRRDVLERTGNGLGPLAENKSKAEIW